MSKAGYVCNPAQFIEFLEKYPDDVRLPLVAESSDWDTINGVLPVLVEIVLPSGLEPFLKILRVIIEAIYVMGYRRGASESSMPIFVVGQETEEQCVMPVT